MKLQKSLQHYGINQSEYINKTTQEKDKHVFINTSNKE